MNNFGKMFRPTNCVNLLNQMYDGTKQKAFLVGTFGYSQYLVKCLLKIFRFLGTITDNLKNSHELLMCSSTESENIGYSRYF